MGRSKNISEKVKQERLAKKRERERKYRERKKQDPVAREIERQKEADRYKRRVTEGKLTKIGDKSEREIRQQRKKWRVNSKTYRDKISKENNLQILLQSNTPPDTPPELPAASVDLPSTSRKQCGRKKVMRSRSRMFRQLKEASKKLEHEKKRAEKYKKKYYRALNKSKGAIHNPSPQTKIRQLTQGTKVSTRVKRALFVGESIISGLKEKLKHCKGNKEKQTFHKYIGGVTFLKRYRLMSEARKVFKAKMLRRQERLLANPRTQTKRQQNKVDATNMVRLFLEQDDNSKQCPGKKDCITQNKLKVQKRVLSDTLQNLHKKFLSTNPDMKMSYSSFAKNKPFWIVQPRVSERETCLCYRHENFKYKIQKLHKIHAIQENTVTDVIKALTCSEDNEKCLLRTCKKCKNTSLIETPYLNLNETISYTKWILKRETRQKGEKTFAVSRNVKEDISCSVGELIKIFEEEVPPFFHHILNINHQTKSLRSLKRGISKEEVVIQVDFSENYCCKYAQETQAVHFGASRQQITMHTGVLYRHSEEPRCFCSLSESLRHDSSAIWAHLVPILKDFVCGHPEITTVHFISDGPATQYRNKVMFYMMAQYLPIVAEQITRASWNFTEAGHGKSAADGVGGVLKRKADSSVAQGKDVHNFHTFVSTLASVSGVKIFTVSEEQIEFIDQLLPKDVQTVPGTMKVHQVTWTKSKATQISLRTLSCFKCPFDNVCSSYGSIGLWNVIAQKKGRPNFQKFCVISKCFTYII